MNTLEFGWRVQCAHPECEKHLEEWQEDSGPPGLPYAREHRFRGWFWRAVRKSNDYGYNYITYCPEHADAAFNWVDRLEAWEKNRWQKGKETHKSLFDRLTEWGAKLLNLKVAESVEDWKAENPRPTPPWEKAA